MDPIFSAIGVDSTPEALRSAFERWAVDVCARRRAGELADIRIDAAFSAHHDGAWVTFLEPRGRLALPVLMGIARAIARDLHAPVRLCVAGFAVGLSYRHYRVDSAGSFAAASSLEADAFLLENEHPSNGDVDYEIVHELLMRLAGVECSFERAERWSLPRPTGIARLDEIVIGAWSADLQVSPEGDRTKLVVCGADGSKRITFVTSAEWARIAPYLRKDR